MFQVTARLVKSTKASETGSEHVQQLCCLVGRRAPVWWSRHIKNNCVSNLPGFPPTLHLSDAWEHPTGVHTACIECSCVSQVRTSTCQAEPTAVLLTAGNVNAEGVKTDNFSTTPQKQFLTKKTIKLIS